MEKPKYDNKPSIPAVEVSTRTLEVEIATSLAPIDPDEDNALNGDGNDAIKVDQNGLRVMQDEGGNSKSPREVTEPALPAAPERK